MDPSTENHPIFDNHLLLDTILDYVILGEGKVATSQVKKCRLVNKAWLRSINRVLQKSQNPLFIFNLGEEAYAYHTNQLNRVNLVQFMETVTGKLHLDDSVPLHSIKSSGWGAQPDACRLVLDSLTNCGSGLIALDLELSETQFPFPPNKKFSFPKLNRFTVNLHEECVNEERDINDMQDKIDFMQSVFVASEQLKSFTLSADHDVFDNIVSASFGKLLLASSITHLYLDPPLKESHLQTLINSSLPNLTTLQFCISKRAVEGRLITSILKKVQKTLQNLSLGYELRGCVDVDGLITYQLPLMGKLKTLKIKNMYPSLQLAGQISFQQIVPVLTQLNLYGRRGSSLMFRKWAENLYLPSVTILNVLWDFDGDGLANMQVLHLALPSVKDLLICTNKTVLIFIMKEMKNLRRLTLYYEDRGQFESSDGLDAVLTGIPQESLEALRASPELWKGLQADTDVSLRNLTELETLELNCINDSDESAISEMAFHYAFFKMPKLTKLTLKDGFLTTREMVRIWESEGRSIQTNLENPSRPTRYKRRPQRRQD